MTYQPDLAAYFARLDYRGPRALTVDTLHALSRAHVSTIPFENLDVLLGAGVDLDPAAVEAKLIGAGRGGYCFEQNSLFLRVLQALGFAARPLSARVRVGRAREYTPARTHVFVRVDLPDGPWLCDVGVGAWSLTSAIRLALDDEQATPHEPRRLIADGAWDGLVRRGPDARLFHQVRLGDAWTDVCEFTLEEMPEIDRIVGNWYTSAHPQSHFKDRLIVARATPTGRLTLVDRTLTRRAHDGKSVVETIATADELLAALAREFGLTFPAGTRFRTPGLAELA
ncbi:MAG: arylamine N-acetyltransferase [Myxococcales bacterium]|nr:arylamine N-acetyltransferase [Myxococcales bacterium]